MRILPYLIESVFPARDTQIIVRTAHKNRFAFIPEPLYAGIQTCPVISLLPYEEVVVQACIQEAKFQGNTEAAQLLGNALHEFLFEFLAENTPFDGYQPIIVPLPLSRARLRERGYNQTARIVTAARPESFVPNVEVDEDLLVRARNTLPQTSCTGNERRTNMKHAFAVQKPCDPLRTYILVDDVLTTGNTMLAAIEAMRAGDALRLLPLTLAY